MSKRVETEAEKADRMRVPDRRRCLICEHSLGCHNGQPPYKCSLRECECPFYVEELP